MEENKEGWKVWTINCRNDSGVEFKYSFRNKEEAVKYQKRQEEKGINCSIIEEII